MLLDVGISMPRAKKMFWVKGGKSQKKREKKNISYQLSCHMIKEVERLKISSL